MGEGDCETVETSKKGRHRKKQLYSSILHQMEFYFSDSNLSKDRFLSNLISQDPYVDIKIFLSFNKIRKLNCTIEDICKAISKSELIEVSEDKEKIRRKTPVKVKENTDECTIYVENIKADANHDWLKHVFSDFGNVVYVSIPKYKQSKENKGFAFVEFETETEAQHALDYFENVGCKMPSTTDPESLRSIKSFDEHGVKKEAAIEEDRNKSNDTKKRALSDEDDKQVKKIKSESVVNGNLEKDMEVDAEKKETEVETESEVKKESADGDDSENKKKKKPKKDKKKTYIRELGLQILSKTEWKKMRNRYLDLQRKKMKEFKYYLYKQNQKSMQRLERCKKQKDDSSLPAEKSNVPEEAHPKLEYVPGVIVKLKLPEPCTDLKKLKADIKNISPDVRYVDIPVTAGSDEVYVRFGSDEGAKKFCSQEFTGTRTLLEAEEEKSYWDKIQNDRTHKFAKSAKKQRGRDKLLKKAERERAKHIRFDEGD